MIGVEMEEERLWVMQILLERERGRERQTDRDTERDFKDTFLFVGSETKSKLSRLFCLTISGLFEGQ